MSSTPENRRFTASISVGLHEENRSVLIEISPAPIYGGPVGMHRVRVARKWLNLPESNKKLFFSMKEILEGPVSQALGLAEGPSESSPSIPTDLPYNSRVSVYCGEKNGLPHYVPGWSVMPPIQGRDGIWYLAVSYNGKRDFFPVDRIKIPTKHEIYKLNHQQVV